MTIQELIDMVDTVQFETKEEWIEFQNKALDLLHQLPPEEQKIIMEENVFESLSMVISGYEYEEERLSKLVSKGLIKFNKEQINYIKSLGLEIDFNGLSVDNLVWIEKVVANELQRSGFDENYNVTDVGEMCESILDNLAEI